MKRSQIYAAIELAHRVLREHGIRLPEYAYWSPDDWRKAGSDYARVTRNGLGWAVTDFGQGNFDEVGITMFDVRNGTPSHPAEGTPYGEKIFVLKPGQRLPYHFHWNKTEDIISRCGGTVTSGWSATVRSVRTLARPPVGSPIRTRSPCARLSR